MGIRPVAGGRTENERKVNQRAIEELAVAGLVTVFRARGLKMTGVSLTDAGEVGMRRFLCLPGMYSAYVAANRLSELTLETRKAGTAGAWVPEMMLYRGGLSRVRTAAVLAGMLLPALIRGYVESGSSTPGHVAYRITAAGRSWLQQTPTP